MTVRNTFRLLSAWLLLNLKKRSKIVTDVKRPFRLGSQTGSRQYICPLKYVKVCIVGTLSEHLREETNGLRRVWLESLYTIPFGGQGTGHGSWWRGAGGSWVIGKSPLPFYYGSEGGDFNSLWVLPSVLGRDVGCGRRRFGSPDIVEQGRSLF